MVITITSHFNQLIFKSSEQSTDDYTILYRPLYVCVAQQSNIDTQHLGHQVKTFNPSK